MLCADRVPIVFMHLLSAMTLAGSPVLGTTVSALRFTRNAVKIKCRPRVSQHGGATKAALDAELYFYAIQVFGTGLRF
jgi:hypothetical protein